MNKSFEQVFGNVGNGSKVVGWTDANKDTPFEMRKGKTSRDKANGHIAGKKNRRMFVEERGKAGEWVKV